VDKRSSSETKCAWLSHAITFLLADLLCVAELAVADESEAAVVVAAAVAAACLALRAHSVPRTVIFADAHRDVWGGSTRRPRSGLAVDPHG